MKGQSKMKTPISKRVQYLCRRSVNEQGVTGTFITRLRTDVQARLGTAGFRFLENHLDAKDGRWYASSNFSWPRLLLNSPSLERLKPSVMNNRTYE